MTAADIFTLTWNLFAAVLLVRGTSSQKRVNEARLARSATEALGNHGAITDLVREIPWYRFHQRRARRTDIEKQLADDPGVLRDYRERQQELAAWNDLETVAALLFGLAVFQVLMQLL